MATLAFFFALTGGAMAATKYLVATDTIPATSDLAGSTYQNPLIAAGAITSDKFAATAKAPDADTLDGLDSTQFHRGYVGGSSPDSTVSVPPGASGTAHNFCPVGMRPVASGYFPLSAPSTSALRTVEAALFINDTTGAWGYEVTMFNEGGASESFHVTVRCASVE